VRQPKSRRAPADRKLINYADLVEMAVTTKKNVDSTGDVRLVVSPSGASDEKDAEYQKPYELTAFHGKKHRHVSSGHWKRKTTSHWWRDVS
jgi:hypothetical protein